MEINVLEMRTPQGEIYKLTKKLALQFPIIGWSKREDMYTECEAKPALAKVPGKVLDKDYSEGTWLILIETSNGYAWSSPHKWSIDTFEGEERFGDWVEDIPTIILP